MSRDLERRIARLERILKASVRNTDQDRVALLNRVRSLADKVFGKKLNGREWKNVKEALEHRYGRPRFYRESWTGFPFYDRSEYADDQDFMGSVEDTLLDIALDWEDQGRLDRALGGRDDSPSLGEPWWGNR